MKVYFKNHNGKELLLAEVDGIDEAEARIKNFLNERDYAVQYMRHWTEEENGKTRVYTDFGSHTEFFIIEY